MMELEITGGITIIDDECYDLVKEGTWRIHKDGYVYGTVPFNGRRKRMMLHRLLIFGAHNGLSEQVVDHKNGIRYDNRLSNLRVTTQGDNATNRHSPRRGLQQKVTKSGEKYWYCMATYKGVSYGLGSYKTENEAKEVVAKFWQNPGEWARLIKPRKMQSKKQYPVRFTARGKRYYCGKVFSKKEADEYMHAFDQMIEKLNHLNNANFHKEIIRIRDELNQRILNSHNILYRSYLFGKDLPKRTIDSNDINTILTFKPYISQRF